MSNFFWNLRRRLENLIPYWLLWHKAKIRRLIFAEEKKDTIHSNPRASNLVITDNLIYENIKEKDSRSSSVEF